ncbi:glutamyl-tRNA amidotransferase [Pseudomonas avellanae]|uniref:Glutamyl-tRNA amidotransferase n=2 Tax=Pseudomonas syringae group TaxID=136849 RepID=A0A261WG59_9PSED|nr:GAD-like domain-containing protein [Pseudomonas syringae]ATV15956.1 glutamyl-tRNA amidotransferase [Pseudomonas syringae pv. actinidiae]OZI85138.1 glutamyl-tRNA amidotransferase [Pseudomonas avellanae]PIN60575.1 glutamyl-tRNA amidotransferase [Pseudomonas syringae pv. actinidiae]
MDEDFAFFLKKFGPAVKRQQVPATSIDRYTKKLPEQLLKYWEDFGWCGYAKGLFWTVDPQDYDDLLKNSLAGIEAFNSDNYHVIARSAFGELYVWGEKSGYSLSITSYMSRYSTRNSTFTGSKSDLGVKVFFLSMNPEVINVADLFEPALEKRGRLDSDEMYGFVPAIALGSSMELKNLQKVKVFEHLEFLSQLSPLQDWGFPDF